ncbi:MAG: CPBP family intramembrane metalloprotease [Clostridia bacterium]|nr:CPBP family intramembrane metalloprotease [Clostridia bacterium]
MLRFPTIRAALYLVVMLCVLLLPLPELLFSLSFLAAVLLLCVAEWRLFAKADGGAPICPIGVKKDRKRLFLLFAPFELFSLLAAILTALCLALFGISTPEYPQSFVFFVSAVVLAPLAEELLCRGLLFRVFSPFGAGWSIFLTALLFSFLHGSLYQIPYAFLAGLFLGYLREESGSLLYPVLFHAASNLLSFFSIPTPLLFGIWIPLSVVAVYLLVDRYPIPFPRRKGNRLPLLSLVPIFAFCAVMLLFAVLSEVL